MLLNSIDRVIYGLGLDPADRATRREIADHISFLSPKLEEYMDRDVELKDYTYYFDTTTKKLEYFLRCIGINSITSVKKSFLGTYGSGSDISMSEDTDYIIGTQGNSIVLQYAPFVATKGLQVVVNGGLATHPTRTTFYFSINGDHTQLAGKYILGYNTEAVGLIKCVDIETGIAEIDVLSGKFEVERLNVFSDINFTQEDGSVNLAIISFITRGLAETAYKICKALEVELGYWRRHPSDFENTKTGKDGTHRRSHDSKGYDIQPETESLLMDYKRITFF